MSWWKKKRKNIDIKEAGRISRGEEKAYSRPDESREVQVERERSANPRLAAYANKKEKKYGTQEEEDLMNKRIRAKKKAAEDLKERARRFAERNKK